MFLTARTKSPHPSPCSRHALALWTLLLGICTATTIRAEEIGSGEMELEQLLQISVTGAAKYEQRQAEVAAAVSVITRDEIKAYGWRTLAEALNSLPGVHITYDRQYNYLGLRGFGLPGDYNTRVLLAINGNRINEAVFDAAMPDASFPLSLDLIERIEFVPGPAGAVYGQNAMFGVVNIVTRNGIGLDGGELSAGWQQPQALLEGRVSWGRLLGNGVDLVLSASGMQAEGEDLYVAYPGATPAAGIARGLDGERAQHFFGRVARGPWSLDLIHADRRKDDPTGAYRSDPLAPGQYQRDYGHKLQLVYQDSFDGGRLNVLGRLFWGSGYWDSRLFYSGSAMFLTGYGDWVGGEARLVYTGVPGHKLMLGLEAQDNYRVRQTVDDLNQPGLETDIRSPGQRMGLYAQDEWRLNETVGAIIGLRLDRGDRAGTQTSPRLAVLWQATANTSLKALYGRAHREPNAYERDFNDVFQIANPDLVGETIDTFEVVADSRVSRSLSLRTSAYHWRMKNLITLETVALAGGANTTQYRSGERIDASGLEISGIRAWDNGARLRASMSYQDVAYASGAGLINSPRWLGRLNFTSPLPWSGLRLGYELQYDGSRRTLQGNRLDDYWLSNLNLSAERWVKGMTFSLRIHNLFDQRYVHPGSDTNWQDALEQDGRSLRLRVDYRF